ncbi:Colicin V production protein [Pseudobythopirellula maris]|uniref:Colicin V production protein n=1 Tax=Pseudobythopirellula maris TaxID=2527991 RepID=A0A5C5ZIF2_9BACT|nr:CvpA family protein [Pseudobythopirellula maris]TWT86777.1 Colicin V production protein [Pseudobythopirellula maris]
MQTYDLLMIAVLVGMTLYGYSKGMAWQLAYFASFIVSYFVAIRFADRVAPHLTFVGPPTNKFVAILLIYAATSLVIWLAFRVVDKAIDRVRMEGFDHQMGGIIGFGRGVLWCVALTFFALTLPVLPDAQKQGIIGSKSGRYIAQLLDKSESIVPPEVHQVIGPYLMRLETELNQGGGAPQQQNPYAAPAGPTQPWGQQPTAPSWPQTNFNQSNINQPTNNQYGEAQPNNGFASQPSGWPTPSQPSGGQPTSAWPTPSQGGAAQPSNATPAQPASWPQWPPQ